ncbi:MAG TPA: hypothetical protein VN426_02625 [Syntrophomonadaceae bacterium]|nr:hypothetical protein [Syntrophomonadaceae bacterium]
MKKSKAIILILVFAMLAFSAAACQKQSQSTAINQTAGTEESIFTNFNVNSVMSQPTSPTVFTIDQPCKITSILDYHYLNKGALPGTITLKSQDGTVYGPWKTEGTVGQGNVANANWIAKPNIVIKAGTYTVIDSDPATWSQNPKSNGCGFTEIKGIKQK